MRLDGGNLSSSVLDFFGSVPIGFRGKDPRKVASSLERISEIDFFVLSAEITSLSSVFLASNRSEKRVSRFGSGFNA